MKIALQGTKELERMTACKKLFISLFLIFQIILTSGMGMLPDQTPEKCALCGRDVHKGTETIVSLEKGKEEKACCIKCALRYETENSKKALSFEVTDFDTGKIIQAENAFYVSGSDFTPCCNKKAIFDERNMPFILNYDRCLPSIIAFKTMDGATKFSEKHGSKVLTFKELKSLEK